jgi:hypothetical protein
LGRKNPGDIGRMSRKTRGENKKKTIRERGKPRK